MTSEAEAVEALTDLGLSEYEARCFVALTQLSEATAKEISQVADVPQSRVYDVTDQLFEMGLVDVQPSDPKRFIALPVDGALARIRREYTENLDTAEEQLTALERRKTEEDGVWEIADREDVALRVTMHVEDAEDEVYLLVARDELLDQRIVDPLADAAERGVRVLVEVPSESTRRRIRDAVPDALVTVTDFSTDGVPELEQGLGRLLMVDQETILLSATRDGLVPGELAESGVWGSAVGHGLVVWIRHLLAERRDRQPFEVAAD